MTGTDEGRAVSTERDLLARAEDLIGEMYEHGVPLNWRPQAERWHAEYKSLLGEVAPVAPSPSPDPLLPDGIYEPASDPAHASDSGDAPQASYSLAEIRSGTGWPKGQRFAPVPDGEVLPDVPYLTGVSDGAWHAVDRESLKYLRIGPADSVTFAECGELVRVAPKFGAYDRNDVPVAHGPCQRCAWTVAAATAGALDAEVARLEAGAASLAPALADPRIAARTAAAILARSRDEDDGDGPEHPKTILLLAAVAAHEPVLLLPEACAEGDCDHPEGGCPYGRPACPACSLRAGSWAGEWQGQFLEECIVAAPCQVLLALAASTAPPGTCPDCHGATPEECPCGTGQVTVSRADLRERVSALAAQWESESGEMRAQSVRDGLDPALAGGHREANLLRQRAADLRELLTAAAGEA